MSAVKQIFAEIDTNAKVLGSSVNLRLQTLMVVHQQFNSRNITATSPSSHSQQQPFSALTLSAGQQKAIKPGSLWRI